MSLAVTLASLSSVSSELADVEGLLAATLDVRSVGVLVSGSHKSFNQCASGIAGTTVLTASSLAEVGKVIRKHLEDRRVVLKERLSAGCKAVAEGYSKPESGAGNGS